MEEFFLKYPKSGVKNARRLRRNMTKAERVLWRLLREQIPETHFRRQVPFGPYVLDFASLRPRIAIELDGSQHYREHAKRRDQQRDEFLRTHGFEVLRFSNEEFLNNQDGVVLTIYNLTKENALSEH